MVDPRNSESMSNPRVFDTIEEAVAAQTSEDEWLDGQDQETDDDQG